MAAPLTFLALGDSYTVGEGIPAADSWPHVLAQQLAAEGRPTNVTVLATTAWTAGELLSALESAPPAGRFDLISLLIGVNDQYRGHPIAKFEAALAELFEWTHHLAAPEAVRFALSIPDWGVTPFAANRDRRAIAGEIDAFNRSVARRTADEGIPFVDITQISRRPDADLAEDGLHPGGGQYRSWVEEMLPTVLRLLEGQL